MYLYRCFVCSRAERLRVALAKRLLANLLQYATAADTSKHFYKLLQRYLFHHSKTLPLNIHIVM